MNRGLLLWLRTEFRRRWTALALLAVLVAVAGGAAIAGAAAARRTDTAFPRLLASTNASTIGVNSRDFSDLDPSIVDDAMAMPGVRGATEMAFMAVAPVGFANYFALAVVEQRGVAPRPVMIEGDPVDDVSALSAETVLLNESMQRQIDAHVGDVLQLRTLSPEQFEQSVEQSADITPGGPTPTVSVVAVGRDPEDVSDAPDPFLMLPPSFYRLYRNSVGGCVCAVQIMADPQNVDSVIDALRAKHPDADIDRTDDLQARVQDTVSLQRRTWWVIAGVAAFAAIVALSITTGRVTRAVTVEENARRALGFTRRDQLLSRVLVVLPAAVVGAGGAIGVAYLLSSLAPVGLTRLAEPQPGRRWDGTALLVGAVMVLVGGGLVMAAAALSARQRRFELVRRARIASPEISLGNRLAVGPGAGAIVAVVLATAGVVGAFTLQRSVQHVVATPSLFGADFDASNSLDSGDDKRALAMRVAPDPDIDAVAVVWTQLPNAERITLTAGSRSVTASPAAFENIKGHVATRTTHGHEPSAADEVALGATLMKRLGAHIGDRITATGTKLSAHLTVVGDDLDPGVDVAGTGMAMTAEGLNRLTNTTIQVAVFRVRGDADRTAVMQRYEQLGFTPVTAPSEILHLGQLGGLPMRVGQLLTVLGVIALVNSMVLTLRIGRREVALHRALGFTNVQVLRTHWWQGFVIAVTGLAVGGSAGFIMGRAIERRLVHDVGAISQTVLPATVWWVAVVTLMGCLMAGSITAALAVRHRAGFALRAE